MIILRTQNLTKSYDGKIVVDSINLSIDKGDILGFIGQNGAGKTTFMRMITSLVSADKGQIELFETSNSTDISKARKRMSAVIENPAFFANLSSRQNLEYYRIKLGIADKSRVDEVLNIVGLGDSGNKKFKNYSLGMKQRLGLGASILNRPDFIVLDEPINGLDPTGITEIRELIIKLNREGVTFLISSHILSELSQIANKYALIHKGKLLRFITDEKLQEECMKATAIIVDNAIKAAHILETVLGIYNYKQISNVELRIYEQMTDPSELTFQLNNGGVRLSSIHEVGDTLEEYYAKVIGDSL